MSSIKTVDENGNICYKNDYGDLHREDGPAVEYADGGKVWLIKGKYHREDGPAFEYTDGDVEYWLNGKRYLKEDWEEEVVKIRLKRILDL